MNLPWVEGVTPSWDKKGVMQNRQVMKKVEQLLCKLEQYQEDERARHEWIAKVRRRLQAKKEEEEKEARWKSFCGSNADP